MTDKQTLLALAARCEAATCADYALDLEIAEYGYQNDALFGVNYDPRLWMERNCWEPTASLDAAMTLVPIECYWQAGHDGEGRDPSMFAARVFDPMIMKRPATAVAETPSLALCAACLRARAGAMP
ncbi:hypothetical protein V474_07985 [Novosphingobium barchaimii LL02]|uniref:Uncharacterized protein n=1 Tax=Novosphingobium barchaimii LL02 TaxID=1114963 RepID=A0A0J8B0V8_9SPHN|nr:hypothetical protein [Novosphingobium barchaimii]KMS60010.1 hypothetical protein V474_07985 [Novosphingobium barchaimii LL02]